jgi:hypothetical protein
VLLIFFFKKLCLGPDMVGHTWDSIYSRGRDKRIVVAAQPGQKVSETWFGVVRAYVVELLA